MAFFKYNTITTGLKISKKLQAKMCIGKINHLFTVRNNKKTLPIVRPCFIPIIMYILKKCKKHIF